jgi:hypothetical protein
VVQARPEHWQHKFLQHLHGFAIKFAIEFTETGPDLFLTWI